MPHRLFGLVLAGFLLASGPALAAGDEYEIDPEHFSVAFKVHSPYNLASG